jgi:hypothetical protein
MPGTGEGCPRQDAADAAEVSETIPDKELLSLEIKELNRKVKEKGVSREVGARLKQRRRALKNRNYASSCREKKDLEISNLEDQRNAELEEVKLLEDQNEKLRSDLINMAEKYERIFEFATENNVNLGAVPVYHACPGERPSD